MNNEHNRYGKNHHCSRSRPAPHHVLAQQAKPKQSQQRWLFNTLGRLPAVLLLIAGGDPNVSTHAYQGILKRELVT